MPRRKLTRAQLGPQRDPVARPSPPRVGRILIDADRILEERGLVTLQRLSQLGKADSWEAQITPAGRELLEANGASA